jgi:hypothetical protein
VRRLSVRRPVCEGLLSIDLAWLRKYPVLKKGEPTRIGWNRDGVAAVVLVCVAGQGLQIEINGICYMIGWRWSDTQFGGSRRWFACPRCDLGCRVLYINGGLACRKCLRLSYASDSETPADNALKRARRIIKKLGGHEFALPMRLPPKPKFMHWSTYWALKDQCVRLQQQWINHCAAEIDQKFGRAARVNAAELHRFFPQHREPLQMAGADSDGASSRLPKGRHRRLKPQSK